MILIGLGANLNSREGPPKATLTVALGELARHGASCVAVSPFYATPAWPNPAHPPFVNAVACVETALAPAALMSLLQAVEIQFGRIRGARNAPRALDLDLLDFDGRIEEGPPLLPHPRLETRSFVLVPLADVAPYWRHPASKRLVSELIAALPAEERALKRLR